MKLYVNIIILLLLFLNLQKLNAFDTTNKKGSNIVSLSVRDMPNNVHIKQILYKENVLYQYIGYYGVATIIMFDKDETITNLIMGDTTAWKFHNLGNKLLLKPVGEQDVAETNAIIYTNKKRTYHIMMKAEEPTSIYDRSVPFEIRFLYSKNDSLDIKRISEMNKKLHKVNITNYDYINFDYTVSGHDTLKPLRVFDDRKFTYFKFHDINGEIPAIFAVQEDGYESIINFKIQDNYIVVDRVESRFTLRQGDKHACVYNDTIPYTFIRSNENEDII